MDTAGSARSCPASPGLASEVFKLPEPADNFLENSGLDYFCVVLLFLLCIPGERDVAAPSLHPPGFLQGPGWAHGSGKSLCPCWANPQCWQPALLCQGFARGLGVRLWPSCSVEGGERAGLCWVCSQEGQGMGQQSSASESTSQSNPCSWLRWGRSRAHPQTLQGLGTSLGTSLRTSLGTSPPLPSTGAAASLSFPFAAPAADGSPGCTQGALLLSPPVPCCPLPPPGLSWALLRRGCCSFS